MNISSRLVVSLAFFAGVSLVGCSGNPELSEVSTPETVSAPAPTIAVAGDEIVVEAESTPAEDEPVIAPSDPAEQSPPQNTKAAVVGKDSKSDEAEIERAEAYLAKNPNDRRAATIFGGALVEFGYFDRAIEFYKNRLSSHPDDSEFHYGLGWAYEKSEQWSSAVGAYEQAIKTDKNNLKAFNNLAWILATAPEDKIRDGKRAITLSKQAIVLSGKRASFLLETLAAAFAENGEFELAVEAQRLAIKDAPASSYKELRSRQSVYEKGLPYRIDSNENPK